MLKTLAILLTLSTSHSIFADVYVQPEDAYVFDCESAKISVSGQIQNERRVFPTDLWEASLSQSHRINYEAAPGDSALELQKALAKLKDFYPTIAPDTNEEANRLRIEPFHTQLLLPPQAPFEFSPPESWQCAPKQILAMRKDLSFAIANEDLYTRLSSPTEVAAVQFHELMAKTLAPHMTVSPQVNRRLTGCAFTTDFADCMAMVPLARPITFPKENEVWHCESEDKKTSYYLNQKSRDLAYDDRPDGQWQVVLDKFRGHEMTVQTSATTTTFSIRTGPLSDVNDRGRSVTPHYAFRGPGPIEADFEALNPFPELAFDFSTYPDTIKSEVSCKPVQRPSLSFAMPHAPKLKLVNFNSAKDYGDYACTARYLGWNTQTKLLSVRFSTTKSSDKCVLAGKTLYFRHLSDDDKYDYSTYMGINETTHRLTGFRIDVSGSYQTRFDMRYPDGTSDSYAQAEAVD